MRSETCRLLPEKIEMMGTTFRTSWFRHSASRFIALQTEYNPKSERCDVTELVQEAIVLGLEMHRERVGLGRTSWAEMPACMRRAMVDVLVRRAARKQMIWYLESARQSDPENCEYWKWQMWSNGLM